MLDPSNVSTANPLKARWGIPAGDHGSLLIFIEHNLGDMRLLGVK
jgi:hypothetical protein